MLLGGSKSVGHGVLADEDPACTGSKYSATEHPAYAWPSVLAHELRLEYAGVGFGSFHCSRMAAGANDVLGSAFDPDFPMMVRVRVRVRVRARARVSWVRVRVRVRVRVSS